MPQERKSEYDHLQNLISCHINKLTYFYNKIAYGHPAKIKLKEILNKSKDKLNSFNISSNDQIVHSYSLHNKLSEIIFNDASQFKRVYNSIINKDTQPTMMTGGEINEEELNDQYDISDTSNGISKYQKKEFSETSHTNQLGGAKSEFTSENILEEIFNDSDNEEINFDDKETKVIKKVLNGTDIDDDNKQNNVPQSSSSQEIVSSLSGGSSEFSGTSNLEVSESYNTDEIEYVKYNTSESESQYEFREPHSQKRFD